MEHLIKFCMKHIYSKSYMVFQSTPWNLTLGGIERSNEGHWVFIGLCIIGNVLLDSGVVRPRPCPRSEMRSRSKWKVSCTSTMIVQLICTKYMQICEAVWAESRTQSTTCILSSLGGDTHRVCDSWSEGPGFESCVGWLLRCGHIPVVPNWFNKGLVVCITVCGCVHLKDPLGVCRKE